MLSTDEKALLDHFWEYLTPHKQRIFKENVRQRTRHVQLVVEDLYHAHNVSAILRSCECFGVQNIHVLTDGKHGNRHFQDMARVARGAAQWLTIRQHASYSVCREELRSSGIRTVALSPHADKTLYELRIQEPLALVFGREWEGVSAHIMEDVDEQVRIPMYGFTESFNISVTAALCLQDLTRRLRNTNLNWPLSEAEQETLLLDWARKAVRHSPYIEQRFREQRR